MRRAVADAHIQVCRIDQHIALQVCRRPEPPAAALSDEASGPRGAFLPVPADGTDPTVTAFKGDVRGAKGKMLVVESGDWGDASNAATQYQPRRFGNDPPDAVISQAKLASAEVYAACGMNPGLFTNEGETGMRESYRQALHSLVAPLGKLVSAELSAKLETPVTFDWQELRAGDISGRARAFQSLVGGGMAVDEAAALSGLMTPE